MRVPLWLKIGYSVWAVIWTVLYAQYVPPKHFLWLCHIGNFLMAIGLWLESPLLLSWQAVSVLVADLLWVFDLATRLLFGVHPLGATVAFFVESTPLLQRGISLFHVVMPLLLMWTLWRFGYDRRAIWCQLGMVAIVFPISFWLSKPLDNINWVWGPFNKVQEVVSPRLYLLVAMIAYSLALFIPSHLILCWLVRRPAARRVA